MKQYLNWNQRVDVSSYHSNYMIQVEKNTETVLVNKSAYDVISYVNGCRTLEEVYHDLCLTYSDSLENVKQVVDDCIKELYAKLNLQLIVKEEQSESRVHFHKQENIYPKVASIEITSKCNLRCRHCYGEFGKDKLSKMEYEKIFLLLNDLKAAGVEIIELTGGDITMHSRLYDVINVAVKLDFKKIGVLTNGIALGKDVMEIIIAYTDKVYMQIDVHSLKDEYTSWFTQVDFHVANLLEKINYLSDNGVLIRIATIFTKNNLNEFFEIGEYVKSIHQKWGISPVEPLGRAVSDEEAKDLYLDVDGAHALNESITRYSAENPGIIFSVPEERINLKCNCGALTDHVAIDSNGNIKLCTMDNLQYCNTSIGNVFEESIASIYHRNSKLIVAIANQQMPTEATAECMECENKYSCMRCMLRTLINIEKTNYECKWYNNLNLELKTKFYPDIQKIKQ